MKKVAVLMSTYNGEKYLEKQLDSILNQTNIYVELFIRDDGSKDETINIINRYKNRYTNIYVLEGNNLGPAKSFWELLRNVNNFEYYAFCDQDDIWLENKLYNAVSKLEKSMEKPSLYYSRLKYIDENDKEIILKESMYQKNEPSFDQLMFENNATGCTMVWNDKLHKYAKKMPVMNMRMHDHMLFLLVKSLDGYVFFDSYCGILYRQHSENVIGGKNNVVKYIKSIWRYLFNDSNLSNQVLNLVDITKNKRLRKKVLIVKRYNENRCLKNKILLMKNIDYKQKSILKNIMISFLIILGRF